METRAIIFILFTLIFLGAGCQKSSLRQGIGGSTMTKAEHIQFTTLDGVVIYGNYVDAGIGAPHALLLHMMPATKESFEVFASRLKDKGISSLAIDFRGHGESNKKFIDNSSQFTVLDYKKFSDAEQQAKILDVRAAVDWLKKEKGAVKEHLVFAGASIGANLALQYLKENPEVPGAALLSPGFDYRGIHTKALAEALSPDQAIYLAASKDDSYSLLSNRALFKIILARKELKELENAGHGTEMFEHEDGFIDEVTAWIKRVLI